MIKMLWLGMASVLAATAAYNVGVVLQALDAREEPASCGLQLGLLRRLLHRRRWLIGTALSILAFPLQVVAYATAPLTVVQPGLAVGLVLVLVLGARYLGESIRGRDYLAVGAIVGGVALIAASGPARSLPSRGGPVPVLVMTGLAVLVLAPYLMRSRTRTMAVVLVVSSGLAFAWSDLATKLFSDGLSAGAWMIPAGWLLVVAVAAVVATLSEMTAFQQASVRKVVPTVYVLETLAPLALAPLLLHGDAGIHGNDALPMGLGLVLVLVAIAILASSDSVASLLSPKGVRRRGSAEAGEPGNAEPDEHRARHQGEPHRNAAPAGS
jgi:drug/metabolite transporter (DMT)-like permease